MSTRSVADQILNEGRFNGIFAGWGMSRVVAMNYSAENTAPKDPHGEDSHKPLVIADTKNSYSMYDDEKPRLSQSSHSQVSLGSFLSIALAGCDLMSSALYTPGTVATYSGKVSSCRFYPFQSKCSFLVYICWIISCNAHAFHVS